jgi:hypothetical protein
VEKHFGDLPEVKEALRNLPPLPEEEQVKR